MEIVERPRNKEGKFVKHSSLTDKQYGVRLYRDGHDKFQEIAAQRGISENELIRQAIREWLELQKD